MEAAILENFLLKHKNRKLIQEKLFERQRRYFKRKRKLRTKKKRSLKETLSIRSGGEVRRLDFSDDDCPGDSEESDSDEENHENNNKINNDATEAVTEVTRKQFSKTRQSLAEDQLENNKKGDLVCLTCLKTFANIQNLRRHLRLHLQRDSNIAEIDSEIDEDKASCDRKKLQCDFCPEKFDNKAAFQVHEKTHSSQELICFVCEKKYLDRYSLRYHLRTHGIGLQIRCELCGKNFTKQSRLRSHIDSIHKNIRKFQCPNCDKAFKAKIHLDNHMLQHSGDRPFQCGQCGENFRHKLSLISHSRIHTDSRPYVCDTCGRAFRDNSTLKAHTRVHSGDKPYKCNLCDKSFTQRAGLNYHKNVHSGTKPHKCNQCDFATAKKASLINHIKTMHKNDPVKAKTSIALESLACDENKTSDSLSPPPLPSPPSQQGDALYKYQESLSNTLPSFNILKSYNSSSLRSLQDAIVGDHNNDNAPRHSDVNINQDRFSSYESHSDPSLSPPLTPPLAEFQGSTGGGQQALDSYSYHSSSNHSFAPLNFSTSQTFAHRDTDCPDRYQNYYSSNNHQPQFHYKREVFSNRMSSEDRVKQEHLTSSDSFYGRETPIQHQSYLNTF